MDIRIIRIKSKIVIVRTFKGTRIIVVDENRMYRKHHHNTVREDMSNTSVHPKFLARSIRDLIDTSLELISCTKMRPTRGRIGHQNILVRYRHRLEIRDLFNEFAHSIQVIWVTASCVIHDILCVVKRRGIVLKHRLRVVTGNFSRAKLKHGSGDVVHTFLNNQPTNVESRRRLGCPPNVRTKRVIRLYKTSLESVMTII